MVVKNVGVVEFACVKFQLLTRFSMEEKTREVGEKA